MAGTLGTSDIGGTAYTMPASGNPITGAAYAQEIGTPPVIINGGTLALVTRIGNIGTIESGTVTTTLALNTGTITTIVAGTQNTLGTVGNLNNGSVNILSGSLMGTILGGTVQNLNAGTITVVSNLTNGSVNILTGTHQLLGTLQLGTVQQLLTPNITQPTYGTLGTAGALAIGTMVGGTSSGAGTEIFVTGCSIVIPANAGSQDVSIGFGTNAGALHQGTGELARGFFVAGGGISKTFNPPRNSGTNAQLTYVLGGAGSAFFHVDYFTTTSTL